jgi:CheY-like chemotaxis protein
VVLAVSPVPADRVRLREILSQGNWKLHEVSGSCEALVFLRDQSVPVLLCECDHADSNWEELLNATARLPAPPKLIVFSRLANEALWANVLNLGGFDVLMTPFEPAKVLRVIFAAWSGWERDLVESGAKEAKASNQRNCSRRNMLTRRPVGTLTLTVESHSRIEARQILPLKCSLCIPA